MKEHNLEAFYKYYSNATKEEVIEDMFLDNCNLQEEIERLNNIIKTKDEGIKAFTEDLCEESTKVEKLEKLNKKLWEENTRLSNGRELDQNAIDTLQDRIERLNNIINELENFMKMQQELYRSILSKRPENDSEYNTQYATMVGNEQLSIILEKLQELKGSDK